MTKTIRLLLALALLLPTKLHSQLIADHTIVEDYAIIPEYYRNEVKKMLVSIPGASHSTAYRLGLQFLEELDARFAVNIAYEESYTENHLRCNRIGRDFLDDEWYTWFAWPDGQRPAEASSVKDMIRRNYENDRNLAAIGYGWCWSMMSSYHSREYDPIHKVRWWGNAIGGPDAGTLGWGLDAGDVGITGNRVNLDTYPALKGKIDPADVKSFINGLNMPTRTQNPEGGIITSIHLAVTTFPASAHRQAQVFYGLLYNGGRLKHPKLILKILVNAQQVAVETKKDGEIGRAH